MLTILKPNLTILTNVDPQIWIHVDQMRWMLVKLDFDETNNLNVQIFT